MSDLVSLRILLVSGSDRDRDVLRHAAAAATVPIDVFEAATAAGARPMLVKNQIDIAFLDAATPEAERATFIGDAKAARPQPFVLLVVKSQEEVERFAGAGADGIMVRPANAEEARSLFERSLRVRMPSRVLVVDDSATMRGIVRKILAASRYRLDIGEAEEGVEALRQISTGRFDLVFLDYNMPGLNGVETLSEIKRQFPDLAVVFMTSTTDDELVKRARASGAAAFLKKPFYPADIDALLDSILGSRG
jgi:DNA-binding response OmpR family regulator